MPTSADVLHCLKQGKRQRILAFGSSNTEHFQSGMHWFDCLELALGQTYGRGYRGINTGISGNSTEDLLARFDEDAVLYQPHWAFITIGGNDALNQERLVAPERYRANLLELHRRFAALGCAVTFQTYYAPDPARCPPLDRFYAYMQTVRDVARETGSSLVDHLARWEPFRQKYPAVYADLMIDGLHVNERGNLLMGLDLARAFGLSLGADAPAFWREARAVQALVDAAAGR